MPGPIEHIDAIACRTGRDVPSLEFHPQPFEEDEPLQTCCVLRDCLEHPDGTMQHGGGRFHVMSLDHATENAAHDEPGFPARWMENV